MVWGNATALFGLALIAVPVLIHLLYRQQARVVKFSTLQFFKLIDRRIARRQRLEELILLLVRSALIALIVLALARPSWRPDDRRGGWQAQPRALVVVLDDSLSMSATKGGVSPFESARRQALELLDTLAEGSAATLVLPNQRDEATPPRLSHQVAAVARRLTELTPTDAGADLERALATGLDALARTSLANRDLVVFSDFAPGALQSGAQLRLARAARRLAARTPGAAPAVWVVDVSLETPPDNTTLSLATRLAAEGLPGVATTAELRVTHRGEVPARLAVTVRHAGQTQRLPRRTLAPGATADLAVTVPASDSGTAWATVTCAPDGLMGDNRLGVAVPLARARPVLVLDGELGEPGDSGESGAGGYLIRALNPGTDARGNPVSPVSTTLLSLADTAGVALDGYVAVFLADVGMLPEGLARSLTRYVKAGGLLVAFAGRRVPVGSPETPPPGARPGSERERRLDTTEWFPGTFVGWLTAPAAGRGLRFGPLPLDHPLLAGMYSTAPDLDRVRFMQAARLRLTPGAGANVVLTYAGGEPALVERPFGAGHAVVFTSTADRAWSNFPLSKLYPALVHRLLDRYGRHAAAPPSVFLAGESVSLALDEAPAYTVRLRHTASGAELPLAVLPGTPVRLVSPPLVVAGRYQVLPAAAASLIGTDVVMVNPTPAESRLAPADAEKVRAFASTLAEATGGGALVTRAQEALQTILERSDRVELWPFLLLVAVLVLLIETALANRRLPSRRAGVRVPGTTAAL